jgi:hypothetical protein
VQEFLAKLHKFEKITILKHKLGSKISVDARDIHNK